MGDAMKIKVTYFPIEAVAEKVRLALVMTNTPFEDERIEMKDWAALKPTVKYNQLPVLEVDGQKMYQSQAQLRFLGRLGDGSLYPQDPTKAYKIDLMLGLCDDLVKGFIPSLYLGMRHTMFGYPEDWSGKAETVKAVREKFIKDSLPVHMEHLTDALKEGGGKFVCGDTVTIADLQWYPQLRYFTKGVADHIPADCLNAYPEVVAYMERMLEVPQIKEWYSKH
mmetsp:Transcript_6192/g.10745  ORF Transcript_6192/g.10745 Transcript_6192/m.10745 type:complete len:223 (-) Transcript_6192:157-825(-)